MKTKIAGVALAAVMGACALGGVQSADASVIAVRTADGSEASYDTRTNVTKFDQIGINVDSLIDYRNKGTLVINQVNDISSDFYGYYKLSLDIYAYVITARPCNINVFCYEMFSSQQVAYTKNKVSLSESFDLNSSDIITAFSAMEFLNGAEGYDGYTYGRSTFSDVSGISYTLSTVPLPASLPLSAGALMLLALAPFVRGFRRHSKAL